MITALLLEPIYYMVTKAGVRELLAQDRNQQ